MHFSIPDTEDVKEENGSVYIAYNLHINGVFHCSVRYRQLHNLHHQLCKELGGSTLPSFPPKKLLSLNPAQIEERRISLEKYVLQLSQDPRVLNNDIFNGWLVWAQNETQRINGVDDVLIDVYTMNGQKISLKVSPTLQTNDLLEKVCKQLNLPGHLVYYFSLYLMKRDNKDITIVKKLQDFESPYISQKCSRIPLKIVLRKSMQLIHGGIRSYPTSVESWQSFSAVTYIDMGYWDQIDDSTVSADRIGLNLIYIQTVAEVERGWVLASKEVLRQLAALQSRGAKMEYLELAQTLKYYGYMQFQQCICDFPQPNTPVLIAAGNKELNFRIRSEDGSYKEGNFKVTRMRCWRISSLKEAAEEGLENGCSNLRSSDSNGTPLELSFEYLMNKDEMRWIRVISPQAVLISLCLQGMVQHLLGGKKKVFKVPGERVRKGSLSYMKRDGSSTKVILNHTGEPISSEASATSPIGELSLRRLSERLSEISFRDHNHRSGDPILGGAEAATVENNAFNVIGDDNL